MTLVACAGGGFREIFPPLREGSRSALVEYAYFTSVQTRTPLGFYLPPALKEFDPKSDDRVTFVAAIRKPDVDASRRFFAARAYTIRGILRRPDDTIQAEFSREIERSEPGQSVTFYTKEDFAMPLLRSHPGRWQLTLFLEDQLMGEYVFLLGDAETRRQLRETE